MSVIRKRVKLTREEYFLRHLHIINYMLPQQMTDKEAKTLAAFMALEGNLEEDRFSTTGRKIVKNKLNISSGGLGNYLRQLKDKNIIVEDSKGVITIPPYLIPNDKEQEYHFKLEVNGN